ILVALLLLIGPLHPEAAITRAGSLMCDLSGAAVDPVSGRLIVESGETLQVSTDLDGRFSIESTSAGFCLFPAGLEDLSALGPIEVGSFAGSNLTIASSTSVKTAGPIELSGELRIAAPSIEVAGTITAGAIELRSAGPLTIDPSGKLNARAGRNGGDVDLFGT